MLKWSTSSATWWKSEDELKKVLNIFFLLILASFWIESAQAMKVGLAPVQGDAKYPLVMAGLRQVLLSDLQQTGNFDVIEVQVPVDRVKIEDLQTLAKSNGIDVLLVTQFREGNPKFTFTILGYDANTGYSIGSRSVSATYGDARLIQDQLLESAVQILRTPISTESRANITKTHTNKIGAIQAMGEADVALREKRYVDAFAGFARARSIDFSFHAPRQQLETRGQNLGGKVTDPADIGYAYTYTGDTEKAQKAYGQALGSDPNNVSALIGQGELMLQMKRPAEALGFFEKAIRNDPKSARANVGMGKAYVDLGRTAEAAAAFGRARSLGATDPDIYDTLGAYYTAKNDKKGAVEAYQTGGDLAEKSANFSRAQQYYSRVNRIQASAVSMEREGDLFLANGEIQLAITIYTKALFVDANRDSLFAKLGYAYYLNQQTSEAIRKFRKAHELNPGNYEANLYLGILLMNDRETRSQAMKYLETAARLHPEETQTQFYLAQTYLKEGRAAAAVSVLENLTKLHPRNPVVVKELGDAQLENNDPSRAEISYNRAIELSPNFREANEALALLFLKSNQKEKAILQIQKVYAIDASSNIFVSEGLELLSKIVPMEMLSLVRRFPKIVPSAVGMSPINQVGVVKLGDSSENFFRRVYDRFYVLYRTDDRKLRQDFELALLAQYRVIPSSTYSDSIRDPMEPLDFARDTYLDKGLGTAGLDGLFGFEIQSVIRRGKATTDATLLATLFSRVDRTRYPEKEIAAVTVNYPSIDIQYFNKASVLAWTLTVLGPLVLLFVLYSVQSKSRGRGNLTVIINYDPKLESFLTLKLSKKQEQEKDPKLFIVKDKAKYERQKYKNLIRQKGAWVRRMVGRETLFQKVPAREYYCYLYGTIEDKSYMNKTIGNYYMVQKVTIKKGESAQIIFQLEKEEAFVTVFVTKGETEVAGAEIRVDDKSQVTYSRGSGGAFIYLKPGRHTINVTHEGRVKKRDLNIVNLDDQIVSIDMQSQDEADDLLLADRSVEEVAQEFQDQGKHDDAARLYEKAGQADQAAEARADAMMSEGDLEGAAEALVKKRDFEKAGELFMQAGKIDRSNYCFGVHAFQKGDFPKALEYLKSSGQHSMLGKIYEKLGDKKNSMLHTAKMHVEKGQKLEAAQAFLQAECYSDAADLYESLGDHVKAAMLHAKDGNYPFAAELFARAGDLKKAAMAYEKAGLYDQAIPFFKELNEIDKVIELLEKEDRFLEAANAYHEQGMLDEAIAVCQKVPLSHHEYALTQVTLANMFVEKGVEDLALKTYADLMRTHAAALNADALYNYASLLEKQGNYFQALELFEGLLKKDFHHKDVSVRVKELRVKAKDQASRQQNTGSVSETISGGRPHDTRYEIQDELGRGAMGVVYRAKDKMLDRIVAFKTLPHTLKDDPAALESLMKEAQTAAKLNHPNIVTIFDVGQENGNYFMAMEYVEGKTLQQVLKQVKKVNLPNFKFIAKPLCDVMAYAHENRVIHRDIKPSNILLLPNRSVKLMDFGLAKILQDMSIDKTMLRGTPLYMSPEQILGKNIDHRCDIYSLGVLFYEMLAGKPPFYEGDIMYAHLHSPPPPLGELVTEVPPNTVEVIMSCLEKDKTKRPANASALAKGLGFV
jgi:eukaryotic-like serine/threonine-protein kinase